MGRARKQRLGRLRLCRNTMGALAGGSRMRNSNSSSNPGRPAGNRIGASGWYSIDPKYLVAISGIKHIVFPLQITHQKRAHDVRRSPWTAADAPVRLRCRPRVQPRARRATDRSSRAGEFLSHTEVKKELAAGKIIPAAVLVLLRLI